jgi:hypothetical protein
MHNIERWWSPKALDFLCLLQSAIGNVTSLETAERTLLRLAFCRTLIECSNAAFNHQSMSFKNSPQMEFEIDPSYVDIFSQNITFILEGTAQNPIGQSSVISHDARELSSLKTDPFDLVITSPPYANRMSYIRELRPYMYWLKYLSSGRDAGELDWIAIGGTWGVATSRLNDWVPKNGSYINDELESTLARVSSPQNRNGTLLASYIRKYCVDIAEHLSGLRALLKPSAEVHYIVGNSTFYGELLSIENIYAHIMAELGFTSINIQPIRKRNSKKELIEFDVSASWNDG